jgi:hypothetical protein
VSGRPLRLAGGRKPPHAERRVRAILIVPGNRCAKPRSSCDRPPTRRWTAGRATCMPSMHVSALGGGRRRSRPTRSNERALIFATRPSIGMRLRKVRCCGLPGLAVGDSATAAPWDSWTVSLDHCLAESGGRIESSSSTGPAPGRRTRASMRATITRTRTSPGRPPPGSGAAGAARPMLSQ